MNEIENVINYYQKALDIMRKTINENRKNPMRLIIPENALLYDATKRCELSIAALKQMQEREQMKCEIEKSINNEIALYQQGCMNTSTLINNIRNIAAIYKQNQTNTTKQTERRSEQ